MNAYQDLVDRHEEIALLQSCSSLLSWDQETHLPPKGVAYRAKQRAAFQERANALKTADDIEVWLDTCQGAALDERASANVREWRHAYERARKIPTRLIGKLEEASSLAVAAWEKARAEGAFASFRPHLETLLDLKREMADHRGFAESLYDALLEEYERGATSAQLQALFAELKPPLVDLVDAATARTKASPARSLQGHYPVEAQQAFNWQVCQALGFDGAAGRIDTTTHPFCSRLAPYDTRLTTRYDESDFTSSLFGVLHETGHGLYEQGLCQDEFALPSGTAVSLGIHESQSRLWENQIGRSRAFWEHWLPEAKQHFSSLADWTVDDMTHAVNQAQLSFIRVEADEVTYDLHIMVRFEIEKSLIEGVLTVAEIPEAWNALFYEMTGLRVANDAKGCLQDIHWSLGAFGYFPTYSLGNVNAAQLYAAALKQVSGLESDLAQGRYTRLLEWLHQKIHHHGSCHLPGALMEQATGRATEPKDYLAHLRARYVPA